MVKIEPVSAGLNQVFNTLAARRGVRGINSTSGGTLAQLRASLDRGEPVIVHGFFTDYGHVVVVTGYDEGGYYVNDPQVLGPAIPWWLSICSTRVNSRKIYYSRDAFERAIATYDGRTFTTLYMHTLR